MPTPHFISKFVGLTDSVNPYSAAPEGGCSVADNAVIRSRDIMESRRGNQAITSASPINALGWKEGKLLCLGWDDAGRGITGQLRYYDFTAGAFTSLPMNPGALPFDRPGGVVGQHTRFISAQKATYFQSRYGLTKVEALSNAVCRIALLPGPWLLDGSIHEETVIDGVGNAVANNMTVAYRITRCRFGANKELIESEPSGRKLVKNTSGSSQQVLVAISNLLLCAPDSFSRVYRSKAVASGSEPSDEMFLIAETVQVKGSPSLDANGFILVSVGVGFGAIGDDNTQDTSLSVPLYTNPTSGSTIAAAATPAPLAADMAYFKNRLLCLNTTDVHRLTLQIIGTGAGGIADGSTITVDGKKLTFTTTSGLTGGADPTYTFLATAGTVSDNIADTARELVWALNRKFRVAYLANPKVQNLIYARYVSQGVADAGFVLIQRVVPGADSFVISTSSRAGWSTDYTIGLTSDPNAQQAGLSWSPPNQPEAFPLANAAIVGDAGSAGQRIIALKEAALIFKQNNNNSNDGLWRWTDDGVNVALQIADPTVRLIAPETAQPLGNYVFALCDQGVMLFTENGQSKNVSHDQIERELLKLIAYVGRDTMANLAFAVPYEIDGQYILCLPEAPNATSCTIQYVYSVRTETWETWHIPGVIAGTVDPNTGKLVWAMGPVAMAPAGANNLWLERKSGDSTDYQDPSFSIACPVNNTASQMTFSGDLRTGAQCMAIGDLIEQAQATYYVRQRVKTVSYNSAANQTTITLDASPTHPWSNAQNITVLKAIQSVLSFLPFHAGKPLTTKEWGDALVLFRYCDLDWMTVEWSSELENPDSAIEIISGTVTGAPAPLDLFGSKPFGTVPWDRPAKNLIVRCTIPQAFGECALLGLKLTLGNALARWELAGIRMSIDQESNEVVR